MAVKTFQIGGWGMDVWRSMQMPTGPEFELRFHFPFQLFWSHALLKDR